MCRTPCVLALLALSVGLACGWSVSHKKACSMSWDVVTGYENELHFFNDGTRTHVKTVVTPPGHVISLTYDPVNNRVIFVHKKYTTASISSFDIVNDKIQYLGISKEVASEYCFKRIAYDPATEQLFWVEDHNIYSFSLKPESTNVVGGNLIIVMKDYVSYNFNSIAVDSCGGYIYWAVTDAVERARFDGTEREVISNAPSYGRNSLTIDQQTQKLYWIDEQYMVASYDPPVDSQVKMIESADLNKNNEKTIYIERNEGSTISGLTVSKDFLYWKSPNEMSFWKISKNASENEEPKHITHSFNDGSYSCDSIAANYNIEEQIEGVQRCHALRSLLANTDPCSDYCFQGNCSVTTKRQPKCRCNVGYSGERCEVDVCHNYCLNNGVCSLKGSNVVCQCTGGYVGKRCDVSMFLSKCAQTVSLLKEILSTDFTVDNTGEAVNSTSASTAV